MQPLTVYHFSSAPLLQQTIRPKQEGPHQCPNQLLHLCLHQFQLNGVAKKKVNKHGLMNSADQQHQNQRINSQSQALQSPTKSDNSSLKSTPESIQAAIIDKIEDKAAGNSAIMSALSADNTHGKSGALVHRSQRLDDKYKTHNIGKDRPEEQVPNPIK